MDTTFRDGFQSVFGGRVLMQDFMPAVEEAAKAGVKHFEFGGGAHPLARFDNGLRFHPDINGSSTFTGGSFTLYGIRNY